MAFDLNQILKKVVSIFGSEEENQLPSKELRMFCNQCEQTAKGQGCTVKGVCGKSNEVSAIQDLLVQLCVELGTAATAARKEGVAVSAEPTALPLKPFSLLLLTSILTMKDLFRSLRMLLPLVTN